MWEDLSILFLLFQNFILSQPASLLAFNIDCLAIYLKKVNY